MPTVCRVPAAGRKEGQVWGVDKRERGGAGCSQGEDAGEGAAHPAVTWGQEGLFLGPGAGGEGGARHEARPAVMVPPAPPLQEHLECLPGAGGHLGSEPRVAAQVHHAGHGHHAEAGEAAPPAGDSPGPRGLGTQGVLSATWVVWVVTRPRLGPSPDLLGSRVSASGASGYSSHSTRPPAPTCLPPNSV